MENTTSTIIVALIGFLSTVGASIISAISATKATNEKHDKAQDEKLEGILKTIAVIELKTDTLWDIYAKDAIRDAKRAGFVVENSPLMLSETGSNIFSSEFVKKLHHYIDTQTDIDRRTNGFCRKLIRFYYDDLLLISIENDIPLSVTIGIFNVLCKQMQRQEGE